MTSVWVVLEGEGPYCVCASREIAQRFLSETNKPGLRIQEYAVLSNSDMDFVVRSHLGQREEMTPEAEF